MQKSNSKLLALLTITCLSFTTPDANKYLHEIPNFQKQSFFKNDIYKVCSSFEQISVTDAANKIVNPDSFDIHLMNACVFYATLKAREKYKRNPLKISEGATMASSLWASILATDNTFFGHVHPTRDDVKTVDKRMRIFGVGGNSENCNFFMSGKTTYRDLATRAVRLWLSSSGHKQNMLSKKWQYLGCGSGIRKHPDAQGVFYAYFVQNFH